MFNKEKKKKEKKDKKRTTKTDEVNPNTAEETNKMLMQIQIQKKKLEEEKRMEEEKKKMEEEKRKNSIDDKKDKDDIKENKENKDIKEPKVKKERKLEDENEGVEELKNIMEKEKELEQSESREVVIEYEIYELGTVVPRGEKTYKDLFKPNFAESVYTSFGKINSSSRELNKRIEFPEFVFLGFSGCGKSSLIESLIGYPINNIEATNRPIYFTMVNNTECDKPRITVKRDKALKGFEKDVEVKFNEVSEEIKKRSSHVTDQPIYVTYEYRYCLSHTLIDTPGLGRTKELDEISVKIARQPRRHLLVCQNTLEMGRNIILKHVKKIDPDLVRSTFVYTKFYSEIKNYSSSTQVNKLFSRNFDNITSFHVSVLTRGVRDTFKNDVEKYQQNLFFSYHRDLNTCESLHFDKRYTDYIGLFQLNSFLQQKICFSFQENIPAVLNKVRQDIKDNYESLIEIRKQLNNLESGTPKLRSLANSYVVEFLQIINSLISGSSEGNAVHNGQTLEEERQRFPGDNEWRNSENYPIEFSREEVEKLTHSNQKLYGGQQFERLLCEFSYIASVSKLADPSMDEVATSAGINKINNTPNYTWAACDLAQNSAKENFLPLIHQLSSRAVYVINRLADIASSIIESRRQNKGVTDTTFDVNDTQQYRFFRNFVQELFENFVENQSKFCEVKCLDEFYSTKTVYWYQTENHNKDLSSLKEISTPEATKKVVVEMAQDIFERISKRILRNVLLKFYNFFLVPVQNQIWTFIQSKVSSLGDEDLIEKFELNNAKMSLKQDELKLKQNVEKLVEQEKSILGDSQTFSSIF